MENRKRNILFSEEQIQEKVKELGAQITKDYEGKELYILPLLRGSFVFGADIFKAIDLKAKIGFMTTSSYGHSEVSSGTVTVVNDIPDNIEGLDVLIVDDIYTTGSTVDTLAKLLKEHGVENVYFITVCIGKGI
jgi:hypoxanthine phosphoribosyltransferase